MNWLHFRIDLFSTVLSPSSDTQDNVLVLKNEQNYKKHILLLQIEPYLPYEFTCEGMLQRMNVFIEKQVCSVARRHCAELQQGTN